MIMKKSNITGTSNIYVCYTKDPNWDEDFVKEVKGFERLKYIKKRYEVDERIQPLSPKQMAITRTNPRCLYAKNDPCWGYVQGEGVRSKCINDTCQNIKICESKKDCYISNWIENGKLTALSNRYYIYTALKNEQVEISWIQQQSGKLYAPSPYITLLDKLAKAEIKNAEVRKLNYQSVTNIMPHTHVKKEFDLREHPELHDYDKELEYALCPMRFVYGYVLNEHPAYRNEYQQSRAIMRFIQILTRLLENRYTIEEVAEQVFELFPYIRKAEKRQMIDDASQWKLPEENDGSMVYKDYNFTNRRLNLTFLDEETYIGAKKLASMLMSPEGRHGIFCDRKGEEKSRNCEFCPHESYCMKSLFGIDYKGERE